MEIDRKSEEYRRRKLAYELTLTDSWKEFLLPELLKTADKSSLQPILTMDMAFNATNEIARKKYAKSLIDRVERLATDFVNTGDV